MLFFLGQSAFGELTQPVLGNGRLNAFNVDNALEVGREHAIKAVKVFFIFDQADAREVVKILDAAVDDLFLKTLQQRQKLLDGDRHPAFFQLQKELD